MKPTTTLSLAVAAPARRRGGLSSLLAFVLALILASLIPLRAALAQGTITIVRDAEIETLMRDYARPILAAAGISGNAGEIILVNDRSFNAFVADGQRIFINLGAIMQTETPNELIGVIAHEAGHIHGGHLARLRQEIRNAQILSVASMLLGGAAAVGASRGNIGNPGAGVAGIVGGGADMAQRTLLAYQRSEEMAADQAAVRFLNATGQSPMGMISVFRRFADEAMFRSNLDPYMMSHPLPQERISQLERLVAQSPYRNRQDSAQLQARHDLARAKIFGFAERPETVLRRYPPSDNSLASRYARAIVAHRSGRMRDAIGLMDELIRAQPQNAYFHELRGQILLESANPRDAVISLRRAVELAPNATPIRTRYGEALLATGNAADLERAIEQLRRVIRQEPEVPDAYRPLAMAYGRTGQIGRAELAIAQHYFYAGDIRMAQNQAHRAMNSLVEGTPEWLRAKDIFDYVPPPHMRNRN